MEQILESGARLEITVAPFADAHRLLKAMMKAVKGIQLPKSLMDTDMSMSGVFGNPELFSQVVNWILSIGTSDEVEQALLKCMERTTYNGVKITGDLFDDPKEGEKIREDYYTICVKVIEANCKPFFKMTFSGLKGLSQTPTASPQ